jgi:hypothetical protein
VPETRDRSQSGGSRVVVCSVVTLRLVLGAPKRYLSVACSDTLPGPHCSHEVAEHGHGTLTGDQARSPTSSNSVYPSSCVSSPSSVSISSALTPFESRNAAFFCRGASRIVASSRNRLAWSNRLTLSGSSKSLSVGVGASGTAEALCCDCSDCSG